MVIGEVTHRFEAQSSAALLVSQLASSASNAVFAVIVARRLTPAEFGAFALAYLGYAVALGLSRAIVGDVLLMRGGRVGVDSKSSRSSALGMCLVIALVVGAAVGIFGLSQEGGSVRLLVFSLGLGMPVVITHDYLRYVNLVQRRSRRAAMMDIAWFGGLVVVGVAQVAGHPAPVWSLGGLWAASAACAALLGLGPSTRVWPSVPTEWMRAHWSDVRALAVDFILTVGAAQVSTFMVGILAGLSAIGALAGADLLAAPALTLVSAARLSYLPRLGDEGRGHLLAYWLWAVGLAAVWGVGVLLVPVATKAALLGDTWSGTALVLLAVTASVVIRAGSLPLIDVVRTCGSSRHLIYGRVFSSTALVLAVSIGAGVGGVRGAAAGRLVAASLAFLAWGGASRVRAPALVL